MAKAGNETTTVAMSSKGAVSRRKFLRGAALTIGFAIAAGPGRVLAQSQGEDASLQGWGTETGDAFKGFAPGGFIRIPRIGKITLIMPYVEMGQGIYTGAAMMLAEELEVRLDQVELVAAPPDDKLYAHPVFKAQMTGGSMSTRAAWKPLREAGAAARGMLVAAAATRWNVPVESCEAREGRIHCRSNGRSLEYGALVREASAQPVPQDPPLKPASQYRLIGKPLHRLDTPAKVNGTAVFGIDVHVPGMKVAVLEICPFIGGRLAGLTDNGARRVPGVADVLRIDNAVAVTADHFWAAKKGLESLSLDWRRPPGAPISTDGMVAQMRAASRTGTPLLGHAEGDADKAMKAASGTLEAEYQLPLLAHMAMEPLVTTVHVRADECEIWLGTQGPGDCQSAAAKLLGLPLEKVILHNQLVGGGFGRRLSPEMVVQAVSFARQVPYPLKVMWTREQDMHQDRFRPFYVDRIAAGFGPDGLLTVLTDRICGPSVFNGYLPDGLPAGKIDSDAVEGMVEVPYTIPSRRVDWVRSYTPLQLGWWRGVGPAHNVFVLESFIDEIAYKAGRDPLDYRRALLAGNNRTLNVLDIATRKAGWGKTLQPRTGMGISLHQCFNSHVALVCEVEVSAAGDIRLRRLTAAVDAGQPTNPDSIVAQIEGGVLFGLSAALFSSITVTDGRFDQNNFNDYRQLRFNETPPFEVHLVTNNEEPGGIGEAGVVSAAPALANAVFAATGIRVRRLPFAQANLAEKGAETKVVGGSVAAGAAAAGAVALLKNKVIEVLS
jgi:isoquinoline 1-oxidoreductase beta subunit